MANPDPHHNAESFRFCTVGHNQAAVTNQLFKTVTALVQPMLLSVKH